MPGQNNSPKWLLDAFDTLVPDGAQSRKMFGHPAMWVNGNMFVMLVDKELGVRVSDEDKQVLLLEPGSGAFEPRGMCNFQGMLQLPVGRLKDNSFLADWVSRAFDFVKSLPPKQKRKAKR